MFTFHFSVNELLKIKDELTKERDEKLSEISKVLILSCFVLDSDLLILVSLIHEFLNLAILGICKLNVNFFR